jgi:hypothetical protein
MAVSRSGPINTFKRLHPHIANALEEQEWTTGLTKKNHIRFTSPAGNVVIAAGTPSEYLSWRNTLAELRRNGLHFSATPTTVRVYEKPDDTALLRVTAELEKHNADAIAEAEAKAVINAALEAIEATEEYWNSKTTRAYLKIDDSEIKQYREAGFITPVPHELVPYKVHGKAILYLSTDIIAFANSDEYAILRGPRRTRGAATSTSTPVSKRIPSPEAVSPITNVKVLVYRGESIAEEITLAALGTIITDALKPIIKDEIQAAVRDYFKNQVQW